MLTVLKLIDLSSEYLSQKGIESPRLNAELLLAHVLNCKRLDLYLSFEKPLEKSEIDRYRELLRRRGNFEPLQYIIGSVEFYGINLKVNSSVLIPRPETELLVEMIIDIYKNKSKLNIVDVGCGSGNISIALAINLNGSAITAVDVSGDAIAVAEENASKFSVLDKIKFVTGDVNTAFQNLANSFDIVVSNPPYVSSEEYNKLQREIKNYEPKDAVTDNNNGYSLYESISLVSARILKNKGKLFFELGQGQHQKVSEIMMTNGFEEITFVKDYQNIDRIIYGVKK